MYIIENYNHDPKLTLTDFIYLFLTHLNINRKTLDKNGNIQCYRDKHRSLGDISLICQSYYPETNKEEVKEILLNFGKSLVGHFCCTIKKRVYEHKQIRLGWRQCDTDLVDEYKERIDYHILNTNKLNTRLINKIKKQI